VTTIAVLFALHAEGAPWRSRRAFRRVVPGPPPVYETTVGQSRVRVALSGVGALHVSHIVDLLGAGGVAVDVIVAAGLAGGLRPPHVCGEVVVPRRAQSAASGSFVASDPRLVAAASLCGATVIEVLLCADHVVGDGAEKRRLAEQADAVDMESFWILEEAARRGIPSIAVRVIGDPVDETLPLDFNRAIRADGTVNVLNLTGQAVAAPWRWRAIVSFALRQRRAVRELAAFLDRFAAALSALPQ
jgi:nucleoside phosphorylase